MTLNLTMPGQADLKPRITVFGVGGAGGNAVNNMIEKALDGVDFVVANTDAQALQQSASPSKVQLGIKVTEGLGAGARPTVGASAAEESIEQIVDHLAGAHMCFITAGMGGGTGTGAAPIIAQAARELGVLTVGVVTKPFQFEGAKRMRQAEDGVEALQKVVDTLIIIPNQNLFRLANEKTTFTEAFSLADDVLYQGVKGVTDLMVRPGLINLDFADVRAVMDEMGKAMMGTGEAEGEDRAIQAAEKAIANPLLDEISLRGANGVLINITGAHDLTLFELDEAANRIREEVDPEANIIVGSTLDTDMEGVMRVSVVATGIDATDVQTAIPVPRRPMAAPLKQSVGGAEEAPEVVEAGEQVAASTAEVAAQEPGLFESMGVQETAALSEEAFGAAADDREVEAVTEDGLPLPAYQPQVPEFEPSTETAEVEPASALGDFVAPVAPAAGTPSPETMIRLKNAARKVTGAATEQAVVHGHSQGHGQDAEAAGGLRKPNFGIGSLIGRMTGQGGDTPAEQRSERAVPSMHQSAPPVPGAAPAAPQHSAAPAAQTGADSEQDRIEIPAFLRRQAN